MMMKYFFPTIATLLLVACADTQPSAPAQKAQKVKVSATRSLDMESSGLEQFQGSYEMRGSTFRKESFVCSFDADGQFLHLSMR